MPVSKHLTTKEVARLCRVSTATVKRWEIAGLIKSERTNGGHRRFRAEDVANFQQKQSLGLKSQNGDESVASVKKHKKSNKKLSDSSFFHSLLNGSEEEVSNRFINEFISGTPLPQIFDELISKYMREVGELWYEGRINVAQEHLATRTILSSIHKLRSVVPIATPFNKLAICCAIEGDFHELPTHLAQMTFENEGWEVINFGANTPLFSLAEEILHYSPEIICISSKIMPDIERLSNDFKMFAEKISKLQTRIIVGGQGFKEKQIRKRFPSTKYVKTFNDLAQIARQQSRNLK